ncbi:hypothetical protein CSB20_10685 [bacterium DOLZORAL124_64_63]|nr:MAG: hypothetical protein CSB20_10685 [bacterium DOLZORAL124_64_63]
MIKVQNLTRKFGSTLALRDLSFEVAEGCIVGFLGPNGAGKSTTMKILTGSLAPTGGHAGVAGHDVLDQPLAVRRLVGFMPENVVLYTDDTVTDFLRFVAELKGVDRDSRDAHIEELIRQCGLQDVRGKLVGNLSHGYTKRCGLAQALVGDPPVLILDEPTSGLDPHQIVEIRRLIRSFRGRRTVLISSHILSEIAATCDRVLILDRGRLVGEESPTEGFGARAGRRVRLSWDGQRPAVLAALRDVAGVAELQATDDGAEVHIAGDPSEARPLLAEAVLRAGGRLQQLQDRGPNLEEMFLSLTGVDRQAQREAAKADALDREPVNQPDNQFGNQPDNQPEERP